MYLSNINIILLCSASKASTSNTKSPVQIPKVDIKNKQYSTPQYTKVHNRINNNNWIPCYLFVT